MWCESEFKEPGASFKILVQYLVFFVELPDVDRVTEQQSLQYFSRSHESGIILSLALPPSACQRQYVDVEQKAITELYIFLVHFIRFRIFSTRISLCCWRPLTSSHYSNPLLHPSSFFRLDAFTNLFMIWRLIPAWIRELLVEYDVILVYIWPGASIAAVINGHSNRTSMYTFGSYK